VDALRRTSSTSRVQEHEDLLVIKMLEGIDMIEQLGRDMTVAGMSWR